MTVQRFREMTRLGKSKHDLSSRCRGRKAGEDISHALILVRASAVLRRGRGVQTKTPSGGWKVECGPQPCPRKHDLSGPTAL